MGVLRATLSILGFTLSVKATVINAPIVNSNSYSLVDLNIDTPPKSYRLFFDTGSATSWVADATCAKDCPNGSAYTRVGYNVNESSTGTLTGESGEIIYSGDRIAGLTVSDEWSDGNGICWNQKFIAANESTWRFIPGDGFLGLAFSTISNGGAPTVFETLLAQDKLAEPKFGVYYPPGDPLNTDGIKEGLLTLGGSKEHEYVDGELTQVPIVRTSSNFKYEVWRSLIFGMEGTYVASDGSEQTSSASFDYGNVVFDTGAGNIDLASDKVEAVYQSIGMNYTAILKGDVIPLCKDFASWSVSFTFGEDPSSAVNITVTGEQLARPGFANREDACYPPFSSSGVESFTLVGKRLLTQFYTVWDLGSKDPEQYAPKLGFGKLKT